MVFASALDLDRQRKGKRKRKANEKREPKQSRRSRKKRKGARQESENDQVEETKREENAALERQSEFIQRPERNAPTVSLLGDDEDLHREKGVDQSSGKEDQPVNAGCIPDTAKKARIVAQRTLEPLEESGQVEELRSVLIDITREEDETTPEQQKQQQEAE